MAEVQTVQPDLRTNNAAEQPLGGAVVSTLAANEPYFRYGRGISMLPTANMGQIAIPGPNQSVVGNPFGLGYGSGPAGAGSGYGGVSNMPNPASFLGSNFNYSQSQPYNPWAALLQGILGSSNAFAGTGTQSTNSNGLMSNFNLAPSPNPYQNVGNPFGGVGTLPTSGGK